MENNDDIVAFLLARDAILFEELLNEDEHQLPESSSKKQKFGDDIERVCTPLAVLRRHT